MTKLLAAGAAPSAAAVAVCVAAGSARAEAEKRLEEFDGLWNLFGPGEEADAADLLERHGYFEPDAMLSKDQHEITARLRAVLATINGIPSGYAVTLFRYLRTGRLAEAFLHLEWLGGMLWKDNKAFWIAMCQAGEAFALDHCHLDAARQRCRECAVDL